MLPVLWVFKPVENSSLGRGSESSASVASTPQKEELPLVRHRPELKLKKAEGIPSITDESMRREERNRPSSLPSGTR